MAKKAKSRISKVKRNNQTTNKMQKQGKMKTRRHGNKPQKQGHQQNEQQVNHYSDSDESSHDDRIEMMSDDEIEYLKKNLRSEFLKNIPSQEEIAKHEKQPRPIKKKRKRQTSVDNAEDEDTMEQNYEADAEISRPVKKLKHLLPIKTQDGGLVERVEEKDEESESEEEVQPQTVSQSEMDESVSGSEDSDTPPELEADPLEDKEVVTTADLMAARKRELVDKKYRIGTLCSGLLESPEKKLKNFYSLFLMMDEKTKDGTDNLLSVRKLATLSVYEVFKDVLPDYMIQHQDYSNVKLKKDTLALYKFEKELLEFYKRFLQRSEKAANVLRPKKGDKRKPSQSLKKLGLLSLRCLCGILEAKPYFNFAVNICQTVIPFLASRNPEARQIVNECCCNIFRDDKKGEISLTIVRRINHLVKSRSNNLNPEAITCLLSLKIKDINLDAEKQLEIKQKNQESHKKRLINMSKKEKKRKKKLKEVEREMLETHAEENKLTKQKNLTEITKTVFLIYFRILKNSPESKLLSATLEGLSRFAHVINLEFYSDTVRLLSHLLESETVTERQRLHCVQTVFNILSGQADVLNVDPTSFYAYLYASMLDVHSGKSYQDIPIIIDTMTSILVKRRRKISQQILLAYLKRLSTLALQLIHNGSLACLALIKNVMQQTKAAEILLETQESIGSGEYNAMLLEPEYCNANMTSLYEMTVLSKHYHSSVRRLAVHVAVGVPISGAGSLNADLAKLSPEQYLKDYDGSQMSFKPSIPLLKAPAIQKQSARKLNKYHFTVSDFEDYCNTLYDSVDLNNIEL